MWYGLYVTAKQKSERNPMKIYNTDTNETVDISYGRNGCDSMPDLTADCDTINYNADNAGYERYEADSAEITWWQEWVEMAELADTLEHELAEKIGTEAAWKISAEAANDVEFGDQPELRILRLQDAIATAQTWE